MSLKEYKAKRNFGRTAEPIGETQRPLKTKDHAFVVQKHEASHLHYDFRLEMDGVLRSWAVPKGFPFKRGDRRLAVEVEDHPIEYGGFEGTIPEGNYGAGTVMLWDRGTYAVSGTDAVQAWRSGKIHMRLHGKKLKGEWTLVRMRDSETRKPQWLLLKSGEDLPPVSARNDDRSVLTGRSMEGIGSAKRGKQWESNRSSGSSSTKSTPRSKRRHTASAEQPDGPGGKSANKNSSRSLAPTPVLKKLPARRPEFVEPMKAQLAATLPKGPNWVYEIKFDGVRALAIKDGASLSLVSRSGKDLGTKYAPVLQRLERLPAGQAVLDGEIVAVDAEGRSAFQLLQSYQSAIGSKPPLFYYVFDAIQLEGKDLASLPLLQRKTIAQRLVDGLDSVRFSADIQADSQRVLREMQARGLEGLIAKQKDSAYEPGRRSGAWVKFKWTNEQEFVIGGYTQPKGSRSRFGAILVGYYDGADLRFAAKVGTGFDENTLEDLYSKFQKLTQPACPFANLPERSTGSTARLGPAEMRRCTWLRPELVSQVRFAEWTRDAHLRQPAFLGLREDKKPGEVVRETPR
ncbi:MAG TPA: non-homologous end-joining DNA ligase [Verrucomicrobiae bacterium]|nr:non-homologous end-joining DNA ligase [Verrucomicrobiae bacterium]